MELVTLTKSDPAFESYLLGTFSKELRALPVETYTSAHRPERVTFRLVLVKDLKIPSWWKIYFLSCRPELLLLTLGPLVSTLLLSRGDFRPLPTFLSLLGLFFLPIAVFLMNDVQDHLYGMDRRNRRRGRRVIQNGWVTAWEMRRWALVNGVLALAFGVPALLMSPPSLWLIIAAAALCLFVWQTRWGVRYGFTDLSLLLLFGPLLMAGFSLSSFGVVRREHLFVGLALGALTAWLFQVRQFENLFRAKPEGFHTFLGHLPFERARQAVLIEGIVILFLQALMASLLRVPLLVLALLMVFNLPAMATWLRLYQATSPLASPLIHISRWALAAHGSWVVWWWLALGSMWV